MLLQPSRNSFLGPRPNISLPKPRIIPFPTSNPLCRIARPTRVLFKAKASPETTCVKRLTFAAIISLAPQPYHQTLFASHPYPTADLFAVPRGSHSLRLTFAGDIAWLLLTTLARFGGGFMLPLPGLRTRFGVSSTSVVRRPSCCAGVLGSRLCSSSFSVSL